MSLASRNPGFCGLALASLWLVTTGAGAQTEPARDVALLARIKQNMARNLSQVPNYTCLQTIERSRRQSSSHDFRPVDAIRVEVALVEGKELFSWPGAGRFEEKTLGEMVAGGTTTTGDYALHARAVFMSRAPLFTYVGEEDRQGQRAVRYDYRIAPYSTGYKVQMGNLSAMVPYHGSFWADPETLDLIRLEVRTDEIPADLAVSEATTEIEYGKVRVGTSDFLLPRKVQFLLRRLDGSESRNRTEFTGCRQYVGESFISFEEPEDRPPEAEKPVAAIELPPGLLFETRLRTEIDSRKSFVGDPVVAVLPWTVKKDGKVLVPKGAVLHGRIRRLEKAGEVADYFLVGVELSELRFENTRARFFGELQQVGPVPGMPPRERLPLPAQEAPGVGTFLIRGSRLRLPQGLRMVWKTAEAP